MATIGWLLIFAALMVFRSVAQGRGITDVPQDLGDLFNAVLANDPKRIREVLSRKEDLSPAGLFESSPDSPSAGIPSSTGTKTQADLIALGRSLKSQGFSVTEGPPPFGPIGKHSPTGYHYKKGPTGVTGLALDINWYPASAEPAKMDALAPQLVAAGWRVAWRTAGHYDHLHVDTGPPGRMQL